MAINYTYPTKASPVTSDEFLIIDSTDNTTKIVTAASILALGQGSDAGVSSFAAASPLSNSGTSADVSLILSPGSDGEILTTSGTTVVWSTGISGFLALTGGAMTGNITTDSLIDGRAVATDGSKLDGVETGADVTNTTNVTSAGALMDSELASIADVKALNQSVVSGATPVFGIASMTLDDTNLKVVDTTNLQTFADGVDHSLLKARGTGVTTSYVSAATPGGSTFDQPGVFGEISSDEGYFDVHYTGATSVTVTTLSATSTYVYIDKNNALQQQTTEPTRQDWSRKIFTMRIGVNTVTQTIIGFEYLNNPIGHYANSIRDLYNFLRIQGVPFRDRQLVTGRVDNLGFNIGEGSLMEFGGTGNINDANIKPFAAVSNVTYNLMSRTALVSSETNLVKFWDNNTVITALGSTTCVAHRVYRFSSGGVAVQYGQGNYANMSLAKVGSKLEEYVKNPALKDATFLGWWLLEETATVTSGTVDAEFIEYTIGIQGGTSSNLSGLEATANKQDSLTVDGSGVKYTTVDAVNAGLATKLSLSGGTMTGEISGLVFLNQSVQAITPVGGGTTFNASSGSFASLDVSASITSVTVTIVPNGTTAKLFLTDTGASTSIGSWADSGGAAIEWAGGTPPTITTSGGVDVLTFEFLNGTVYGSIVQNYS